MFTIDTALRSIVAELGDEFLERRDHIEAMAIAWLSGQHVFWLGDPGTGKSAMARAGCARIIGGRYWETLLDRQLPQETLFGPVDIKEFEATGDWHRRVDGYLPTATIAFLDEIGKAGPAVLNALLTALNERLYHNNSKPVEIPLISVVAASNEELEPELGAMWDRFLIRQMVEPIREPGNFAALLSSAVTTRVITAPTTITLDQLNHARLVEVPAITLPPGVVDTILELRGELRGEQVRPSDRRWKQSMRVLQASAYLNGRSAVDEDDLAVLRHVLWDVVEQIPTVERSVLSRTSPLTKAALDIQAGLETIEAEIDARHGQSVATRAEYGGQANALLGELTRRLADNIEQANRQGRSTAKLDSVRDQLRAVKVRVFTDCLNMPADRAALIGNGS